MRSVTRCWRLLSLALMLTTSTGVAILAQATGREGLVPQNDPEFARLVKEWTTRPEFISPLVDHLPKAADVPSPKDLLGHYIGQPQKLTYYEDILRYYRALRASSRRVTLVPIGKTDEGRDLLVVVIGSEESIADIEQ